MMNRRKDKRVSRLSVAISAVLHSAIIGVLVFLAAREGILGKELKKIAVTMVPKEKPVEKPKEKPPEPKLVEEKPRTEDPKPLEAPRQVATAPAAPPPAATGAPAAAPPPDAAPVFDFEGGRPVETTSDAHVLYKNFMEYTLRSHWDRPEGIADDAYVAEVEIALDRDGRVLGTQWEKGSGDAAWDNSVKKALATTPSIGRPPPKGFPDKVRVRFDVQRANDVSLE